MIKRVGFIVLLSIITLTCFSQKIGEWSVIPSFINSGKVVENKQFVYFLADGYLYSYNKEDKECRNINKNNKLSDNNISDIILSNENETLFIAYENSNIDIVSSDKVVNIPFIKDKAMVSSKKINHAFFSENRIYVSTDFGVVVINTDKNEIAETYNLNKKVSFTFATQDQLYIACEDGMYYAGKKENIFDPKTWKLVNATYFIQFQKIDDNKIIVRAGNNIVYSFDLNNHGFNYIDSDISDLSKTYKGFLLRKYNTLLFYTTDGTLEKSIDVTSINPYNDSKFVSNNINKNVWRLNYDGITLFDMQEKIAQILGPIYFESSRVTSAYNLYISPTNKLYVFNEGAGVNIESQDTPSEISILDINTNKWTHINFIENTLPLHYKPETKVLSGVYNILEDKNDPSTFYLGTAHEGLYVIKDYKLKEYYNADNSAIEGIYKFIKVSGLQYDKNGYIWLLNQGSKNKATIKIYDPANPNNALKTIPYNDLIGANHEQLLIPKQSKYKWMINSDPNFATRNGFVFIFDDNGTIENTKDDKTIFYKTFTDQDGKQSDNKRFYCITEDKKGSLWIGTDRGVLTINNPNRIFDNNFTCTRIKIPRNDGTNLADFLLQSDEILCISIDGGNRKWIGTKNSGAYLISEDGLETILHFTTDNSLLPSDRVTTIAIDPNTGVVYFGTDKGLVSYRAEAIEGKEDYSNVYAFPNPVRPDYSGPVTITGLMDNSLVKITDTQSNLIFEGYSIGGQITWNAATREGKRVKTGVYLVYGSSSENDNKSGVVTKILIVN